MTKNNLALHLEWLLNRGSSFYPSSGAEAPLIERERVSQQPTPPSDGSALLGAILEDADDAADAEMAKLQFPQWSRKPRLVSRTEASPEEPPSTSKKASATRNPVQGGLYILTKNRSNHF